MTVFARFRALPDKDKAALIRKLVENGTPDFDYFFLIGLSTLMATFGLLLDSSSIVIGSMLIAPLMYPILGVAMGFVMSSSTIGLFQRAVQTLTKSLVVALGLSVVASVVSIYGMDVSYTTAEVMSRTEPNLIHLFVAIVAGMAVAYMLARPEWNDALPGVAIAVALVPPLATIGVGIAAFDMSVVSGAFMIFFLNLIGIIGTAIIIFLMMNLGEKQNIAESTIKREDEKLEEENKVIAEVAEQITVEKKETIKITERPRNEHS